MKLFSEKINWHRSFLWCVVLLAFLSFYDLFTLHTPKWHSRNAAHEEALKRVRKEGRNDAFEAVVKTKQLSLSVDDEQSSSRANHRTIVVYVLANVDDTTEDNFRFFLKQGVQYSPDLLFFIVEQVGKGLNKFDFSTVSLPRNVRILQHENICFDIGTVGWLLFESNEVEVSDYDFFGLVNPSVRGPFLPAYVEAKDWPTFFTSKLDGDVKLAGTAISCGGVIHPKHGHLAAPHIQSYVLFTDKQGLNILHGADVFKCYDNILDTVYYSEIGASRAIVEAGFNLHSVMLRYQGVDWRDSKNRNCNRKVSSIVPGGEPNGGMDPLELMFVKFKRKQRWWSTQRRAEMYTSFAKKAIPTHVQLVDLEERTAIAGYVFHELIPFFDVTFYLTENRHDLWSLNADQALCHFTVDGYIQARPFKLVSTCGESVFGGDFAEPRSARAFRKEGCHPLPKNDRDGRNRLMCCCDDEDVCNVCT